MPAVAGLGRLQRRREFLRVAGKGKRAARPGLVLQALPAGNARPEDRPQALRLGFTVTKKVGNAVVRNRARRRLREAARLVLAEHALPAPPDAARAAWDLVLIGRDATPGRRFDLLLDDLRGALRQAGVLPGGRKPRPPEAVAAPQPEAVAP